MRNYPNIPIPTVPLWFPGKHIVLYFLLCIKGADTFGQNGR